MRLDHVSYATSPAELGEVVQRLGAAVGAPFVDGGVHPRFGTRNFVLPLAGGSYLEVVAALDHPAAETAPFGRAVRGRAEMGGGWLAWVVAVDAVDEVEARLGRAAAPGNRRRPDGIELRWRQIGVLDVIDDPSLPFFVQWLVGPELHPSAGARTDLRIDRLEMAGDPAAVAEWLGPDGAGVLDQISIEWVDAPEPGLVAVQVATPRGPVRLD